MQNKLLRFLKEQNMVSPGDTVICAVSGGADSVALLFAMYLLRERLEIRLEAAHFNHHLRGAESDRDEAFVRSFCDRYDIPLHVGRGRVTAGKKGLEAAARDARYAYLGSLEGKIATAHTADDNAETILLHLIRGTGLKGLGGIAPIRGNLIRPMLNITRREVEAFLNEWCLDHVEDSSNESDAFLRNRVRHQIMPLLRQENPRIAENLSQMARSLREDEDCLCTEAASDTLPDILTLRTMHRARRTRVLERFLKENGVREPEDTHIRLAESLVFSDRPSASAQLPGGVTLERRYDCLAIREEAQPLAPTALQCPGRTAIAGYVIECSPADALVNTPDTFTVSAEGPLFVRSRQPGDRITLPGGSASLKKLYIDRKIPRSQRQGIPVICDASGILGVYSIGVQQGRAAKSLPAVMICIEKEKDEG